MTVFDENNSSNLISEEEEKVNLVKTLRLARFIKYNNEYIKLAS